MADEDDDCACDFSKLQSTDKEKADKETDKEKGQGRRSRRRRARGKQMKTPPSKKSPEGKPENTRTPGSPITPKRPRSALSDGKPEQSRERTSSDRTASFDEKTPGKPSETSKQPPGKPRPETFYSHQLLPVEQSHPKYKETAIKKSPTRTPLQKARSRSKVRPGSKRQDREDSVEKEQKSPMDLMRGSKSRTAVAGSKSKLASEGGSPARHAGKSKAGDAAAIGGGPAKTLTRPGVKAGAQARGGGGGGVGGARAEELQAEVLRQQATALFKEAEADRCKAQAVAATKEAEGARLMAAAAELDARFYAALGRELREEGLRRKEAERKRGRTTKYG